MTDTEFKQWVVKNEAAKNALREAHIFLDCIEQPLEETETLFLAALEAIDKIVSCEQAFRYRPEKATLTLV